jgi:hypothetical protein
MTQAEKILNDNPSFDSSSHYPFDYKSAIQQTAIEFTKWITKNGWSYYKNNEYRKFVRFGYDYKTTEQLFEDWNNLKQD